MIQNPRWVAVRRSLALGQCFLEKAIDERSEGYDIRVGRIRNGQPNALSSLPRICLCRVPFELDSSQKSAPLTCESLKTLRRQLPSPEPSATAPFPLGGDQGATFCNWSNQALILDWPERIHGTRMVVTFDVRSVRRAFALTVQASAQLRQACLPRLVAGTRRGLWPLP